MLYGQRKGFCHVPFALIFRQTVRFGRVPQGLTHRDWSELFRPSVRAQCRFPFELHTGLLFVL